MKAFVILTGVLALGGCTSLPSPAPIAAQPSNDLSRARIGETVYVDGPQVTPFSVLEDSRCPSNVRCVWEGRVRINARVDLGSSSRIREVTQGEPLRVADGTLELVEVQPDKPATNKAPLKPGDYSFGFRFSGGL